MKRDATLFLQDIIDSIESIFAFIEGYNYEKFRNDDKTQSAVIRKIEIISEAEKNIPGNILTDYPDIEWSYMAKMRDRLIHGYFDSDPEIIWKTVHTNLPEIPPKIANIINKLKD